MITCAGCDRGAIESAYGVACRRCWLRLPERLRQDAVRSADHYPATHRLALETASEWLRDNPWREAPRPNRPAPTPEQNAVAIAHLNDCGDVLTGSGRHVDHEREQVGRCVRCSCGMRVQGRMAGAR